MSYVTVKKLRFPVIVEVDEDGYYVVSCPLFKGCHTYGKTIEEALENIENGTYGICEMCDEPIAVGRLKAKPFAKFCTDCREIHENNNK